MEVGEQGNHFDEFEFEGMSLPVEFVETTKVVEGVECDVYKFVGDKRKDLGIIKIEPGSKTPLQKVLKGDRTIEGYVSGKGKLVITRGDKEDVYEVGDNSLFSIDVKIGDTMQWVVSSDSKLVAYEICSPPYEDGRYENLNP